MKIRCLSAPSLSIFVNLVFDLADLITVLSFAAEECEQIQCAAKSGKLPLKRVLYAGDTNVGF